MSRPVSEPSTPSSIARANWDTAQLYRRPQDLRGWHIALSDTPIVDPDSYDPIPFDVAIADVDGYADLSTGIVTIPPNLKGLYLCSFTAKIGVVGITDVNVENAIIQIYASVIGVGAFYCGYTFIGGNDELRVVSTAGLFDLPSGAAVTCHLQNLVTGTPISNVVGGSDVPDAMPANTWFTGVRFPFSSGI